ncbi:MAG: agmatinase [Anaerolineales bacterium]|jgi:agmatinase/guanidinopropionase
MNSKDPNPAFGADLEPYHGIPTFMRLPASREFEGADVAVVGIPFDSGASNRPGTRFGPRKIREASLLLWGYNQVLGVAPTEELTILDYGDVSTIAVDINATMANITREVKSLLDKDVTVIAMGGDHSISLPLLRAHAAKYGPPAVIHFDSHPDTWDWEFKDQPYSHGTPFRRAIEEELIDTSAYLQIGIRGPTSFANDLSDAEKMGAKLFTIDRVFEMGIPAIITQMKDGIGAKPVYVSLDIDAVDPAFAPGTGTPEIGGLNSYQILQLVRGMQGLNIIGFDLVEVSPPYDHGDITAILASNLVFEFISLLALSKKAR